MRTDMRREDTYAPRVTPWLLQGLPDSGYRSYVFTDHLSAERLVELRDGVERDVRRELGIPFNPSAAAVCYEHSMGQGANALPSFVLRRSGRSAPAGRDPAIAPAPSGPS